MTQAEKTQDKKTFNPLIWVSLVVVGLILVIFLMSDRGSTGKTNGLAGAASEPATTEQVTRNEEGVIDRDALVPPGKRARSFIKQLRDKGEPYPFDELMAKASAFAAEGSLADAHLTFFFAAREGHVEAMMMMAEMSDPTLFRSENNLLDKPDAIQAYKWYRRALDAGFEPAKPRLDNLYQWAVAEAKFGNTDARQLLLNYK
jgi:TPR repeat protein